MFPSFDLSWGLKGHNTTQPCLLFGSLLIANPAFEPFGAENIGDDSADGNPDFKHRFSRFLKVIHCQDLTAECGINYCRDDPS
jgi:hypothetical protein